MKARYECPECKCWFWVDEDPMEIADSDLCPECQVPTQALNPIKTMMSDMFNVTPRHTHNPMVNALTAIPFRLPANFEDYCMDPDDPRCPTEPGNPESAPTSGVLRHLMSSAKAHSDAAQTGPIKTGSRNTTA